MYVSIYATDVLYYPYKGVGGDFTLEVKYSYYSYIKLFNSVISNNYINSNVASSASSIGTSLLFTNPDEESCLKSALAFVVLRRRAYYRQHQRLLNENNKEMKTKKRSLVDDSLLSYV